MNALSISASKREMITTSISEFECLESRVLNEMNCIRKFRRRCNHLTEWKILAKPFEAFRFANDSLNFHRRDRRNLKFVSKLLNLRLIPKFNGKFRLEVLRVWSSDLSACTGPVLQAFERSKANILSKLFVIWQKFCKRSIQILPETVQRSNSNYERKIHVDFQEVHMSS